MVAFTFGTPTIVLNVSVVGLACGVGFGSVPVVVPAGAAQGVGVGGVSAAVPAGHAATFVAGGAGAAISSGVGVGVGFGTPSIVMGNTQQDVAASGFASGFSAGSVPVVVPSGFASGFDVGGAPLGIPHGFAAACAFGAPTVVLGRTVNTSAPISGGLASARWHYDELIAEWCRLRKIREDLEARQERLAREKSSAKRARQQAVVDMTAERRLDELIIACNRAYGMLQEREDAVYAGVRAQLANVEAISAENRRALRVIETTYSTMLQADDEDAILALM